MGAWLKKLLARFFQLYKVQPTAGVSVIVKYTYQKNYDVRLTLV